VHLISAPGGDDIRGDRWIFVVQRLDSTYVA
jgi:hypothetical protein